MVRRADFFFTDETDPLLFRGRITWDAPPTSGNLGPFEANESPEFHAYLAEEDFDGNKWDCGTMTNAENLGLGGGDIAVAWFELRLDGFAGVAHCPSTNECYCIHAEFNRFHEMVIASPELLAAIELAATGEELDPLQRRQFHHFAFRLVNQWLSVQVAYHHGSVDDDTLRSSRKTWRSAASGGPVWRTKFARSVSTTPFVRKCSSGSTKRIVDETGMPSERWGKSGGRSRWWRQLPQLPQQRLRVL